MGDFKEIVKEDKLRTEISFCSNEQFHSLLIKQKSRIVNDNGYESANL